MKRIGIVGVGLLGSAVASRLLEGGFEVTGYDVLPECVKAMAGKGLRPAGSVAEAAAGADAVFTILPSLEAVEEVYFAEEGLIAKAPKEAVLMQMSTISPALAEKIAAGVTASGRRFLDTPISGTSGMVAKGDCTLLVAGDEGAFKACSPIFNAIGPKCFHFEKPGMATLAKLSANLLVALNSASMAEALVLASKGGIPPARMLEVLQGSAGDSRMMAIRGPLMAKGEYPPAMKLRLFLKDLRLMLAAAEDLGVSIPITAAAKTLFTETSENGNGEDDLASVMRELEHRAGIHR